MEKSPEHTIPDVVDLNVGGTHTFTTERSTLMKVKGSVLEKMFSGELPVLRDENGRYFIDGNGSTFHILLDYLRYDVLPYTDPTNPNSGLYGLEDLRNVHLGAVNAFESGFSINASELTYVYCDAKKFGLQRLVMHIEKITKSLAKPGIEGGIFRPNQQEHYRTKIAMDTPDSASDERNPFSLPLATRSTVGNPGQSASATPDYVQAANQQVFRINQEELMTKSRFGNKHLGDPVLKGQPVEHFSSTETVRSTNNLSVSGFGGPPVYANPVPPGQGTHPQNLWVKGWS